MLCLHLHVTLLALHKKKKPKTCSCHCTSFAETRSSSLSLVLKILQAISKFFLLWFFSFSGMEWWCVNSLCANILFFLANINFKSITRMLWSYSFHSHTSLKQQVPFQAFKLLSKKFSPISLKADIHGSCI